MYPLTLGIIVIYYYKGGGGVGCDYIAKTE